LATRTLGRVADLAALLEGFFAVRRGVTRGLAVAAFFFFIASPLFL
jgi:hypothetical protein